MRYRIKESQINRWELIKWEQIIACSKIDIQPDGKSETTSNIKSIWQNIDLINLKKKSFPIC